MFRSILFSVLALVTLDYVRAAYDRVSTPTLGGKIIGGEDAEIEDYPYQVSFQYDGQHICGGCLVAPNIVLTAAHCTKYLDNHVPYLSVRAGSTLPNRGGVSLPLKSFHNHPKRNSYDYDISVLVLDGSFPLTESIQLIQLQDIGDEVPDQTLAIVTGWGLLKPGGPYPVTLQVLDIPKLNQETCRTSHEEYHILTDRMHCFAYQEGVKDACQGDSGGPAVVNGNLVGIVSWGLGCAIANQPGVYVKIANREIHTFIDSFLTNYV